MRVSRLALVGACLAGSAGAAEHTRAQLEQGSERAAGIVQACRARPAACADPEAREALARAFFTLVVDAVVNGRAVDPEHVANVGVLDPTLIARLPVPPQSGATDWVVHLTTQRPEPVVTRAPEPIAPPPEPVAPPLPDDLPTAIRMLEQGDLDEAAARLARLADDGDRGAALALATTVERMALPVTSLVLRADWLRTAPEDPRVRGLSREAVRLAAQLGSRQALVDLALAVHPSRWDASVQSDGWLALGQHWQQHGDLSRAQQAYAEVDRRSPALVRARYQVGLIRWQTGHPWEAREAFREAWQADADEVDVERIREMALWNMARLSEELGRPEDALAHYEVLSITASPLSERAAHRCAWTALANGDPTLARRWLSPTTPRGVWKPEDDLLRARLDLSAGDPASARARLERAASEIDALDEALVAALAEPGGAWALLRNPDQLEVVAARLDADPELAGFRAHLAAVRNERRALAAHPDATWRAEVGSELDRRLADHEAAMRARAEAAAAARLVELRRELGALDREVEAQLARR